MAVANVGSTATSGFQTGSSYSFSKVTNNSGEVLRITVFIFASFSGSVTVTYNSNSLTLLKSVSNSAGPDNLQMHVFQMINPPVGTYNIAVTLSSAVSSYTEAHAYSGADQNTPEDNINTWESDYGDTPDTTIDITPNYTGMFVAMFMSIDGITRGFIPGGGVWSNYSPVSSGGNKSLAIGYKVASITGGSPTTATVDNSSSQDDWLILSTIIIEPIVFQPAWARSCNQIIQVIPT